MMQRTANILLVIGTATAALSGASARLPWREVVIERGVAQAEFLAFEVSLGGEVIAQKGAALDEGLCSKLDALGFSSIKVRSPAIPMELLDLNSATGEVLAEAVLLPGEIEVINKGRLIDPILTARAAAANVELSTDSTPPRLSQDITLPAELRVSTFLNDKALATLAAAGVSQVPVKRAQPFRWHDWPGRWAFLLSISVMGVAVSIKRRALASISEAGRNEGSMSELKMNLFALAAAVDQLAEEAAQLSAAEIHAKLDPLIEGPSYTFVENRNVLKAAAGITVFADVMDPFSRGERQLARAWSASVDGHEGEARASLVRAVPLLHAATDAFPS